MGLGDGGLTVGCSRCEVRRPGRWRPTGSSRSEAAWLPDAASASGVSSPCTELCFQKNGCPGESVPVALPLSVLRVPGSHILSSQPESPVRREWQPARPAGHAGPPQEPRPGPPPGILLPRPGGTACAGCTPVPDRNRMPRARWQLVSSEQRSGEQGASSLASPARGRPRPAGPPPPQPPLEGRLPLPSSCQEASH